MSVAMSHITRTHLPVGIVLLVLVTAFLGCRSSPTVAPITKPKVDALDKKAKQASVDPATEAKVAALIEKLKDKESGVRYGAAQALGEIGPAAKDAAPALTEALKDKDKRVRTAAQSALDQIQAQK